MKHREKQKEKSFILMESGGSIPFRVTWQGFWMPECSLSKSRLLSKLNLRQVDVGDFPLPDFPGFQRSSEPPFADRESLAKFLYETIASLFYHPESESEVSLAEEVTGLILSLQEGLEELARSNDVHAADGLLEIAERATAELERELNRDNPTLIERLKVMPSWPSRQSINGGVRQVILDNLEKKGFGENALKFRGKNLASYAQQIVNFLSPYISDTLPVVDSLIAQRVFETSRPEEISPVFHLLKDLPRELTTDTADQWFFAGQEILKLMANNENFLAHPYFKTTPFEGKTLENWNRDLRVAWKTRAK